MSIRIMIADDNRDLSEVLSDYLELCPDIEIAGVSDNGSEAIELLNITKPDVLLLDIVIPGIDGLEVLHRIQSGNCWKPCVFIMSALYSTEIREQAFSMGASFFFVKPLDIEFVVEKILAVPVLKGGDCPKASPVFEFAGDISNIDEKITAILLENGVPANVQGFRYIRDMIGLFCRQEYRGRPTELYEKVAMNYNTTSMRVKKAIHYAVKVAWNRHSAKKADGIFHSMQKHKSGQPGNSQFMYAVAGKLAEG